MREASPQWREDFTHRAREYWNDERLAELVGNRRPSILPSEAPLLLRSLGLLNGDASMPKDRVRKYRQINHMVALLLPSLRGLAEGEGPVRVLDAACGRSYVSMLLAWMYRHRLQREAEILAVDRSPELVAESRRRAHLVGLGQSLRTYACALDALEIGPAWHDAFGVRAKPRGLISLHACDTATDDALLLGVRLRIDHIMVVPCCQAELSAAWKSGRKEGNSAFAPLHGIPHMARVTASHITDMMRVLLLRAFGYEVGAIEFVPMEHTPKNTLIRGRRIGAWNEEAWTQYLELVAATGGIGLRLASRLTELKRSGVWSDSYPNTSADIVPPEAGNRG